MVRFQPGVRKEVSGCGAAWSARLIWIQENRRFESSLPDYALEITKLSKSGTLAGMKLCTQCKVEKPKGDFPRRSKSSDGRGSWCRPCVNAYASAHYKENATERERKARNKARLVAANQKLIWEYFQSHSCVDCGNSDSRVLEFDHKDSTTKLCDVSIMYNRGWAKIAEEIAKCDVRCANCHRIRTQVQFNTWRCKV